MSRRFEVALRLFNDPPRTAVCTLILLPPTMPSAPPTNPFSPPAAPFLPYDLLRLIAIDAAGDAIEQEEREVARAVSLVCRDLRDVGQDGLWRSLTLPRREVHAQLQKEEKAGRRLLDKVRRIRWETRTPWSRFQCWEEGPQIKVDVAGAFAFFLEAVSSGGRLEAAEVCDVTRQDLLLATTALKQSPSRTTLTALSLSGGFSHQMISSGSPFSSEIDLIDFLFLFPSLRLFSCDLDFPPLPSTAELPASRLALAHLALGINGRFLPVDDHLHPPLPYAYLLRACCPATLHSLQISVSRERAGWLRLLSPDVLPSLTHLTILLTFPPLSLILPLLSEPLTRLPSLRHVTLRDPRRNEVSISDEPAFNTFLRVLPPSLLFLDLDLDSPYNVVKSFLEDHSMSKLEKVDMRAMGLNWRFRRSGADGRFDKGF